jgi:hypothetical protein
LITVGSRTEKKPGGWTAGPLLTPEDDSSVRPGVTLLLISPHANARADPLVPEPLPHASLARPAAFEPTGRGPRGADAAMELGADLIARAAVHAAPRPAIGAKIIAHAIAVPADLSRRAMVVACAAVILVCFQVHAPHSGSGVTAGLTGGTRVIGASPAPTSADVYAGAALALSIARAAGERITIHARGVETVVGTARHALAVGRVPRVIVRVTLREPQALAAELAEKANAAWISPGGSHAH